MTIKLEIFKNLYQDSVSLMQISAHISKLPGVEQASVIMGTPANLAQLADAGLGERVEASPNDLLIVVRGARADESRDGLRGSARGESRADLRVVPGDYAAAEAMKARNSA